MTKRALVPSIDKSIAERRRESRKYSQTNREDWGSLGFRYMTVLCHDDDREIALARMELSKFEKMIAIAEHADTTSDAIQALSRKNMTKLPTSAQIKDMETAGQLTHYRVQIQHLAENARYYLKTYNGLASAYATASTTETKLRMEAKAVAFSGASAACLRLAAALATTEVDPTVKIF